MNSKAVRLLLERAPLPMLHSKAVFLFLSITVPLGVSGKNDWSKACLDGVCSFDIDESPASMGGTIKIVRIFALFSMQQLFMAHGF